MPDQVSQSVSPGFGLQIAADEGFAITGNAKVNKPGLNRCDKPQGCTNMNPGCAYLQHPYKRWVREHVSEDGCA